MWRIFSAASRMDASGEDTCLDGRSITPSARDMFPVHRWGQSRHQPASLGIVSDDPGETRTAAQRGDVVRRISSATCQHLGRVVLQNQHRGLARHPSHFAINELVGNDVADDENTASTEGGDERSQPLLECGGAGK